MRWSVQGYSIPHLYILIKIRYHMMYESTNEKKLKMEIC